MDKYRLYYSEEYTGEDYTVVKITLQFTLQSSIYYTGKDYTLVNTTLYYHYTVLKTTLVKNRGVQK